MHTYQYPTVREITSSVLLDPKTGHMVVAKTVLFTGGKRKV